MPIDAGETRLDVRDLHAWYGESHVLHGMTLNVGAGEIVTLIGRNGAGKTTTMRAIMGILRKREGAIRYRDVDIIALAPHKVPRLGIGYVPEERGIFASLSVTENLMLPPVTRQDGMSIEEIHTLFPNLKGRARTVGTRLSGGEQQMLAIARILRTGADFILLDEPTEGLAPVIVDQIAASLKVLKDRGLTILLVEQNLQFAAAIADRHYVVEQGAVIDEVANHALAANIDKLNAYLGV
ncbi:ABC transporter ATP-binding protein [Mesorhizobium australicum]|uniref:Amino acid/amide ABC transporter ATP-binding protein 2, HAAT family n=1 Tax=Mesorhizobium australicum TaxID=536018 RepID=A0A1X7MUB1_9HYPH|nr:ABC transporter ATP-binding protein [Mesorhizobium australicum]SMH27616.1 amino acid/amide ABC transporter ATP-binding protein 2, HAAT family [Mesorhizobium australicum]